VRKKKYIFRKAVLQFETKVVLHTCNSYRESRQQLKSAWVTWLLKLMQRLWCRLCTYTSSYDFSAMTNLISELRSLVALNFISWKVQQRPRSCNRVAYELAVLGSLCDPEEKHSLISVPVHIQSALADDSALSE
jgi:hypothetical protein